MILRVLHDSRYLTRKMDVFDKHYHTYRIILKIIGLWPYNNSIYVWIQRLLLLTFYLVILSCISCICNVIFQLTKIIISLCYNLLYFYSNNL